MRKNQMLFSMLAMAGMLGVTSCSQDEILGEGSGNLVDATFTVSTSDAIGTRAVGDGTTVDKVVCAVFDEKGEEMANLRQTLSISDKSAKFSTRLAKGQDYRVAFFAYNEAAKAYNVENMKNIVVNENQKSNVEGRDAFTAFADVEATVNAIEMDVTLKRPFAQLNLGVDAAELEAAKLAGVEISKSKIVVSNVYKAFSAYDNAVAAGATEEEMVFDMNKIPTESLWVDLNKDNKIDDNEDDFTYLALNYLLVGNAETEKSLTDVEFVWETEDGKTNNPTTQFINIPVQRNFRTNIIGKLLTSPAEFNITIDADFINPNYIVNEGDDEGKVTTVTTTVATVDELQAALIAATSGNHIIKFEQDINANSTRAASIAEVTVVQKQGVSIVIDGCNHKYDGVIKVHANSSRNTGYLAIKNIDFETSTKDLVFIQALEFSNTNRYSQDITVENCTFTAVESTEAVKTAAGISVKATQNLKIKNCTATNMHSLLQAQSCDSNIDVDNVKVINGKNGISFGNTASPTLTNSTISAAGYGVRADGEASRGNLVIKNTTINANIPVGVRKMTTTYSVALEGNNTLTAGQLYQVIFTANSDEAKLDAPTGNYTITGAEGLNVYPAETIYASTQEQLAEALKAGASTIFLNKGSYDLSGLTYTADNVVIEGMDKDDCVVTISKQLRADNKNLTLKNLTTDIATGKTYNEHNFEWIHYFNNFSMINCKSNGRIRLNCYAATIEGCEFNVTTSSGFDGYAIFYYGTTGSTVKVSDCKFNTAGKAIVLYNESKPVLNLDVEKCTFTSSDSSTDKAAIQMHTEYGISGTVDITNSTATGFADVNGGLWNELNNNTKASTDNFEITVDGNKVH